MPVAAQKSPQTGPSRWKRRAEARPEEILDAALAEFAERGFDAARMQDIARRAGLSKAGVYLYFPGKEALLKALIETKVAPLSRQIEALSAAGAADPAGALRVLASAALFKLKDARLISIPRLVIGISGRFPELADFYRVRVVAPARRALEGLITAGIESGAFRRVDPRAAARAFIGPIFFEAMWTHVLGGESAFAEPQKLIDAHLNLLLEGLGA